LESVPDDVSLLFIIDTSLYPNGMTDAIRSLKEQHPSARIVMLAEGFNLDGMRSAFQAGADGYCLATTGCEALIKYLDLVMLGEFVFPSAAFLSALSSLDDLPDVQGQGSATPMTALHMSQSLEVKDSPVRTLSSREAEILQCLMQGAPNKVIARRLEVAEATVKVHIKAILRKIRVANRTQAAMWAVNHMSTSNVDPSWLHSSDSDPLHTSSLMKTL
jgi:two-component system nitrate/nitrite response regulator NarL